MTANFDENLPSCEYQLSNIIQETSKRTESRVTRKIYSKNVI